MLAQQVGVTIVVWIIGSGRTVDEIYVTGIGKLQYAFDVVWVQASDFVHHAMHNEVSVFSSGFLFEHIY